MVERFKYEKRYWYPHMGPLDVKIWERFIDANPGRFDFCIYDLPVGNDPSLDATTQAEMQDDWTYLCKYKCDVIGIKGDKVTIVEIKPRAGLGSLGQIIGYDALYQEYVDKAARPELVICTDELRNDMDWLCEEFGIKLEVV